MKATVFLVCALAVGASVLALAPAAEAKPYCDQDTTGCPGDFCAWDPVRQTWGPCVELDCTCPPIW